jgi:hypothetical protein
MQLKWVSAISLSLFFLLSLAVLADDSVTGKWKGSSKGDDAMEFALDLKQEGEKVTGTITVDYNVLEISGSFKEGTLELVIDTGDNKYVATAVLKDGKLDGKWKDDRGTEGTWGAEKEAASK